MKPEEQGVQLGMHRPVSRRAVLGGGVVAAGAVLLPQRPAQATEGSVLSWGLNEALQLGRGRKGAILRPGPVPGLSGVTAVGAGDVVSYAVDGDGDVWSWGGPRWLLGRPRNNQEHPAKVEGLTGVRAVDAAYYHAMALRSDGALFAWGQNQWGQLGDGTTHDRPRPVRVAGLPKVIAFGVGAWFSAAVCVDGRAYTWGLNNAGVLGQGTSDNGHEALPFPVPGIRDAVGLAVGALHVLVLLHDGSVRAWGINSSGQLGIGQAGDGVPHPARVEGALRFVALAASSDTSFGITPDGGRVAQWGFVRQNGQQGGELQKTPAVLARLNNIKAISSCHDDAGNVNFALRGDGAVFGHGGNGFGQLGAPTPYFSSPQWVRIPGGSGARSVAGGIQHGLAAI